MGDGGLAGGSAQREYERRRAKDEAGLRQEWGRLGGLAVRLADERRSTRAWATGARGERVVGAALDGIAGDGVIVLHDRRIPGSRANIDHLAITDRGVWVVDAKRYTGRPDLRIDGGLLRPETRRLVVGRRDQTKLVEGARRQVDLVRAIVAGANGSGIAVPVVGALCFVDADWPLIGGAFSVDGLQVLWPKRLAKRVADPRRALDGRRIRVGEQEAVDVAATAALLAARLPQA